MDTKKHEVEVKIVDLKTGGVRYVRGHAGAIIPVKKSERVVEYYPTGVIPDGTPILVLEPRG